ncbi:conserved hypothetical protein [Leishmania braziliensis MHOM/BR/75/M2904]|uniref:Replication termination factor 2 n=2 Tax=Leishmania braziliensis TaxID=5660 RepID=A4HK35_LEIBR|nr:conserved hypothetical protein [Leishmania braziliensis MHOM/BR/75/M2904]KAI5687459.1 Rtf2 RINGfinger containing protein [Leishmania braziliensis]CAJ2478379.1 unnamed protein product [Leishmania braziliensis]CAJ2478825.1 unnamed protein product [Leishmania braziliensis]CAM42857.1 conserved hypothetical protein [Leishmania braziliensis MHOM/BR/75/M2904]SYZ68568.1 Rtf2_RING-finger_containing_protein [Leishmania braziliensis MHOM/BR/75/M2904]
MGGDGQALANKRSLLQKSRVYVTTTDLESGQAKEKTSHKSRTVERWTHCAFSLQPLEAPAVFDAAGNVFSKQSVINYLLDRKERSDAAVRDKEDTFSIKKLADVKEISNKGERDGSFCCPITGYSTLSGVHSFVGFWGCGHVVSASTCSKSDDLKSQVDVECPFCGLQSFYVRLVCNDTEVAEGQQKFLRHYLKRLRKRVRDADVE